MFCSWFEDVHVMCFEHYRQIIFSVTQSLFYELVIQLQVDICILDTILMLPEFRIWSRVWGVGNCWGVCPLS